MIGCDRLRVVSVLLIGLCEWLWCDIIIWWQVVQCFGVIGFCSRGWFWCMMLMKWLWNSVCRWILGFEFFSMLIFRLIVFLCSVCMFLFGFSRKCRYMCGVCVVMVVISCVEKSLMKFLLVWIEKVCFRLARFSLDFVGCKVVCVL